MNYRTAVPITCADGIAIEAARANLMVHNFRVEQPSAGELVATGPGMRSTSQNPILGVSRMTVRVSTHGLEIDADLGGVRKMRWFLYLFPPALGVAMAIQFAVLASPWVALYAFAPILPWLVISPLMSRWIQRKTVAAIETLAQNISALPADDLRSSPLG